MTFWIDLKFVNLSEVREGRIILDVCVSAAEELGLETKVNDIFREDMRLTETGVDESKEYTDTRIKVSKWGFPYLAVHLKKGERTKYFSVWRGIIPPKGIASEQGVREYLKAVNKYLQSA